MKRKIHLLIAVFVMTCIAQCDRTDLYNMFDNEVMAEPACLMVENWILDTPNGSSTLNLQIIFSEDVINAEKMENYLIPNNGSSVSITNIIKIAPNIVRISLSIPPSHVLFTISTVTGANPIQTPEGQILTNKSQTFEFDNYLP